MTDSNSHLGSVHLPEADIGRISRTWLDIPYAQLSPSQKLDIYLPESGDGPFPVVLNIHGGAFARGDKRDVRLLPMLRGLSRGHAVVSVNYRLSGEAIFPAGVQDVKAAIRWLRARGHEYLLDPERIVAWGNSSGANFAAIVAVTADESFFDDPALGNAEHPATCAPRSTGSGRSTSWPWTSNSPRAAWAPVITAAPILRSPSIWARR